jgi:Raf kinase inhibitor-like YbhB/YbcL family protein
MEKIELRSDAFQHGGDIPDLYTCRGKNISPPLSFHGAPKGTESFALLMADLDTPVGTVTHWVVYNIPADFGELAQGFPPGRYLESGVQQGRNGMFRFGYMGPCPPWGRHRYLFRLFALERMLQRKAAINRRKLLHLVKAGVLAEATLLGYYPGERT